MNHSNTVESDHLYPWLGNSNNLVHHSDEFRMVKIPDVHPMSVVQNLPHKPVQMSVSAGEFLEIYDTAANQEAWDAIATCFFLDTAPNVIHYIKTVYRCLKPGGIWSNIGPLQYHWQTFGQVSAGADPRYQVSLELGYDEIKSILLQVGFNLVKESFKTCHYNRNEVSMKQSAFNCVHFTVRKG